MMDHTIPKPAQTAGYPLHRLVAELLDGAPALFADQGDRLIVRTEKHITAQGRRVQPPALGDVIAFELKACAAQRHGGRNIYPERGDWRTRRAWLEAEGVKHGFEVMAVHITGDRLQVSASGGRRFWIDASQFTGVLKVTEATRFAQALSTGIGRVGKAFGMGLLII